MWKPEIRVPSTSDYVLLSGLDWNTDYEVQVVAENQQGKSLPGVLSFRTAAEPTSIPGTDPQSPQPRPQRVAPPQIPGWQRSPEEPQSSASLSLQDGFKL